MTLLAPLLLLLLLVVVGIIAEPQALLPEEEGERRGFSSYTRIQHPHILRKQPLSNFTLELGGKLVRVQVVPSKGLLSSSFFLEHQGKMSQEEEEEEDEGEEALLDNCHYQGKIVGVKESWVAVSHCDGGSLRGVIFDGLEMHHLEPDHNTGELIHLKGSHYGRNSTCPHTTPTTTHNRVKRSAEQFKVPYNSNAKSRYVELVIVVDNKKHMELGSSTKATVTRVKDIVNIVNALYTPFNIFIALSGVVIWSERDEISITPNGDDTLSAFLAYRRTRLLPSHPNDNAQLLTAREFDGGVVGKAMQGPMCSYKYSGGVNSDFSHSVVGIVATTVAHEMGHNFGLSHDTEDCHCSTGRCVMAASASSNRSSAWSSCSIKDMAYALDHGMDYCLRNIPSTLYDSPTCGNGFTEEGEECDCGIPSHCTNPCCDPYTCRLHGNATCGSGTCCDLTTCNPKEGGTLCRDLKGACDLPEYCNGDSQFCPEDVTKLDGLGCETGDGKAYCYKGECRPLTGQCKLLWGPSGNNSDDLCYARNTNGSKYAHCGYNLQTEKYSACTPEDAKCGVLHCQMHNEKLEYGYESASLLASFFVNSGGNIYACRSVVVDFGLSDTSPGMVPDGAPCGEHSMCLSQKCVGVAEVIGGRDEGCGDCEGRGVCNSKGHCHCDEGWGGLRCEGAGWGGSVDSGPPHGYGRGGSRIARLFKVTLFGFIPLIALITFYLYYSNGSLKPLFLQMRREGLLALANPHPPAMRPPGRSCGGGGGGGPSKAPQQQQQSNGHATSNGVAGKGTSEAQGGVAGELYGQYKGFSLSPIKTTPQAPPPFHNNNAKEEEHLVKNEERGATANSRGVSWAQPIALRVPLSPPSEEEMESNHSESPLHHQPPPPTPTQQPPLPTIKREGSFTALTNRVAAAIRATLTSRRSSNSPLPKGSDEGGRKKVEISGPILQQPHPTHNKPHTTISINPLNEPRYENIPLADESSTSEDVVAAAPAPPPPIPLHSKPMLKSMERVKEGNGGGGTGDRKRVGRAQSMIQPGGRNSMPNYNSLRRGRPQVPPPNPPPSAAAQPASKAQFFKSSTPPPYNPTKFRDVVGRLSFGRTNGGESSSSPSTRSSVDSGYSSKAQDNIYDTIDEGMGGGGVGVATLAQSEEISPGALEERMETTSTGSSEGVGGLLSEIISEIKTRNRDSIYNSLDRKKQKAMRKALANAALEKERQGAPPPPNKKPSTPPSYKRPAAPSSSSGSVRTTASSNHNNNYSSPPSYRRPAPPPTTTTTTTSINNYGPSSPSPLGRGVVTRGYSSSSKLPSAPIPSPKPIAAVNGIPKTGHGNPVEFVGANTTTPLPIASYLAKISPHNNNSSSSVVGNKKPLSSLHLLPKSTTPQEMIYAPTETLSSSSDHHLSTIRRSRPSSSSFHHPSGERGIYGSLGRKVATPIIPTTTTTTKGDNEQQTPQASEEEDGGQERGGGGGGGVLVGGVSQEGGYKPFNPYLNRPLTFSTFKTQQNQRNGNVVKS